MKRIEPKLVNISDPNSAFAMRELAYRKPPLTLLDRIELFRILRAVRKYARKGRLNLTFNSSMFNDARSEELRSKGYKVHQTDNAEVIVLWGDL